MTRSPPSLIPNDHRRAPRRFLGITEDGTEFDLEVREARRRASSSDLVKAHIRSVTRGMPLRNDDLYRTETEIALFIRGRHRVDIRINPNGSYSIGHRTHPSLRETIMDYMQRITPDPAAGRAP